MARTAGASTYRVLLGTSSTAEGGTYISFLCEGFEEGFMDGRKAKPTINGKAYRFANGTRQKNITLRNGVVTAQQTATASQEWEAIKEFIYTYSNKSGASPLYLFFYHETDTRYMKLAHYSDTHQTYFKCYVDSYSAEVGKGSVINVKNMRFVEWTN